MTNGHPLFVSIFRAYGVAPAEEEEFPKRQKCDKPVQSADLRSCPYQADVNDNPTPWCNCCDDCAYECAMDI